MGSLQKALMGDNDNSDAFRDYLKDSRNKDNIESTITNLQFAKSGPSKILAKVDRDIMAETFDLRSKGGHGVGRAGMKLAALNHVAAEIENETHVLVKASLPKGADRGLPTKKASLIVALIPAIAATRLALAAGGHVAMETEDPELTETTV